MPFQIGNVYGGPRENAGRPKEWLKEKCRTIVDKKKLVEFLGDVASGKRIEQVVTADGVEIQVPAAIKERLKAVEMLLNRGYGKVEDADVIPTTPSESVKNAEASYRLLKDMEARADSILT